MTRVAIIVALLSASLAVGATERRADCPLATPALLKSAGAYLDAFDRQFSAVVSEEEYEQISRLDRNIVQIRRLRSDLLLLNQGRAGWLSYRDVYEVDGKPIRDREDRLLELFLEPAADSLAQAKRIYDEGARFNIGRVQRTVNSPTLALAFLRLEHQWRSEFKIDGDESVAGRKACVASFVEQAEPHMIDSQGNRSASGRFWIEPESGRVLKSELTVNALYANARVSVIYDTRPELDGLWVPVRMDETYSGYRTETVSGKATYAKFRRFKVSVGTIIK
ncbi:MAG TPA: hypothetical protein VFO19_16325 [Vicinamibacterales bacterium]|nr:hypothetical protein [Vicinamibacterales bacterium]